MEELTYFISEVSRLVGVEPHVLRYWEEELGLTIGRNSQGKRCYTEEDVEYFRKVKYWKDKGMQLKAVKELLHGGKDMFQEPSGHEAAAQWEEPDHGNDETYAVLEIEQPVDSQQMFTRILDEIVGRALERNNEKLLGQISEALSQELEAKLEELLQRELLREEVGSARQEAAAAADRPGKRFWARWKRR